MLLSWVYFFLHAYRLATRFFTNIPQSTVRGVKLLGPIIEDRQKYLLEYGTEWDDKPVRSFPSLLTRRRSPRMLIERPSIMVDGRSRGFGVDCRVFDNSRVGCQFRSYSRECKYGPIVTDPQLFDICYSHLPAFVRVPVVASSQSNMSCIIVFHSGALSPCSESSVHPTAS